MRKFKKSYKNLGSAILRNCHLQSKKLGWRIRLKGKKVSNAGCYSFRFFKWSISPYRESSVHAWSSTELCGLETPNFSLGLNIYNRNHRFCVWHSIIKQSEIKGLEYKGQKNRQFLLLIWTLGFPLMPLAPSAWCTLLAAVALFLPAVPASDCSALHSWFLIPCNKQV